LHDHDDLDPQQRAAATHDGSHALVLAGAGTGKTRTIIARAGHLLAAGTPAERILALTFTRRAADEIRARLEQRFGDTSGMVAGTFHHFCLRSMRRMPRQFGIEQATVIDRDDATSLMKLVRGEVVDRSERRQFPKAGQLVTLLSYARNTNRPLREYLEQHSELDEETMDRAGRIFGGYRARKQANRYLDYDDILHYFAATLHRDEEVRARLRGLFDHVLVDEMQDTNPLQWLILEGLRDPARLFCVGDDAQSIYAFRGADFRNVHSFTDRVQGGTVLKLERNYRSTQEILDLANWLLGESGLTYGKELVADRGAGVRPRLLDFDTGYDEARWIATDLQERFETGAAWEEHMILTRTAWAAREMEAELVARDIPYRFTGGTSLMQSAHVKDLLCMVRAALNPLDELAWARYLTLWPGIGDVTAARLIAQLQQTRSFDEAVDLLRGHGKVRGLAVDGIVNTAQYADRPSAAVLAAIDTLDPLLKERYDRWDGRRRDLDLLARLAERHRTVAGFLETYALEPVYSANRDRAEDDDAVSLITVHSAKGTEAPVCYLIRVEPGNYPHSRSLGDDDDEEEERRILYVAMTRARDELVITRTNEALGQRVFWGAARAHRAPQSTAYLLEGLPDAFVDMEDGSRGRGSAWDDEVIQPWRRR